jgi:trigger factor
MDTTVKQLSETKVQLTITLGAQELTEAQQVALTKLSKTTKVPGFRKGKVPAGVAAKHVDPQALQEQTMDDAISRAVAEAFLKEEIQAVERPTVEVKKYVPGEQLEFTAVAEVLPKIELGDYKKLSAKKEKIVVADDEIDQVFERMRAGFAERVEVKRKAQDGDEVEIDFVGKKDGVAFEGGTATDYALKLGGGQFIPGFEEGVIGHKIGDNFDLDLEFPEEYHSADLAGQKVTFTVTLKNVFESKLPELDDEFAKKTGSFETFKDLKADVVKELTTQKEREQDDKYKDALIVDLISKSKVVVPEVLVTEQANSIEQDFEQNLLYRGLSIDSYIQTQGFKDADDWRAKEVTPTALKRVQAGLVLAEVTKAENIEVSEEEIEAQVATYRTQYASNPDALKQLETPTVRKDIANQFATEKTVDRLVELNTK